MLYQSEGAEEIMLRSGRVKCADGMWQAPEAIEVEEKFGKPYCHVNCGTAWRQKTKPSFCPGCGNWLAKGESEDVQAQSGTP